MFRDNEWYKKMSLDAMKRRLNYTGGDIDGRLVKSKLKSMHKALHRSYQAEWITLNDEIYRCLINPDKLKEDYDQKIISIDFNSGMKEGDTFLWNRTNTHWIVYLQQHSEEAYFRAQIRKCNYELDVNGHKYWIYLRGPVETALVWRQKHQIETNDINYSLIAYITKNEETLEFFKRFTVIKIGGHNWRVAARDEYSQGSILELNFEEFFDNEMEDKMIIPEIKEFGEDDPHINGPQFIEPYQTNIKFSLVNVLNTTGEFVVNSSKVKIVESNNESCTIDVLSGKSGNFDLIYRVEGEEDIVLNITIESF